MLHLQEFNDTLANRSLLVSERFQISGYETNQELTEHRIVPDNDDRNNSAVTRQTRSW
jgi:hypothetical protein